MLLVWLLLTIARLWLAVYLVELLCRFRDLHRGGAPGWRPSDWLLGASQFVLRSSGQELTGSPTGRLIETWIRQPMPNGFVVITETCIYSSSVWRSSAIFTYCCLCWLICTARARLASSLAGNASSVTPPSLPESRDSPMPPLPPPVLMKLTPSEPPLMRNRTPIDRVSIE